LHTSDKRRWQVAAALITGILAASAAGTLSATAAPVHVPKCYDLTGNCQQNPLPPPANGGGGTKVPPPTPEVGS
jgi:hypothetical protein